MFDEDDLLFVKRRRRHAREPSLVPIIDMMTTVIFFLLLSAGFTEYTKHTLPPSKTSTITDPVAPPPLAPKLVLGKAGEEITLLLTWGGTEPGIERKSLKESELETGVRDFLKTFHEKHPDEKSLQLALSPELPYRYLVSAMDGVRENLPDIVLISGEEAEARLRAAPTSTPAASPVPSSKVGP